VTFKPAIWQPIAIVLSVINVVAAGFAAGQAEPLHATIHTALAVAFGVWAQRLGQSPRTGELQGRMETLEFELGNVRRELGEVQERLDFAERMLAQVQDPRRVGPERQG